MDNATAALAKMNMILHNNPTAEIWQGNTLASPHWQTPTAASRPLTLSWPISRFPTRRGAMALTRRMTSMAASQYGIPPDKNGDYAFLLHILKSLKSTGKGAVILPHGVLFRGNVEAEIRKKIVRRGYIKGIIGLPPNLFYGTGIPACIIVLDKENAGDPHRDLHDRRQQGLPERRQQEPPAPPGHPQDRRCLQPAA